MAWKVSLRGLAVPWGPWQEDEDAPGACSSASQRLAWWALERLRLERQKKDPRPAPPRPAGASSSCRRGACPLVPASPLGTTEGSRGSGRRGGRGDAGGSGGAIRARGSLPNPAVPAANCAWSDGCPRGGVATGVPPPMTAVCGKLTWSWEARRRHVGLHLNKPQKDSSSEGPTNLRPGN
ncbi:PREDICTED: uncharacterized protein LOC105516240 [Colobus angolensis palliatus]|uniref:uncharacterized protein LOC105516240 n=1 Tax=Colobus angolensis palliatus TaxID=336983 RepID=UPI0005F36FB5|nr:PREDICTED: uncharacterized protein LOC105516240 [Colobus angolensis palliatus]